VFFEVPFNGLRRHNAEIKTILQRLIGNEQNLNTTYDYRMRYHQRSNKAEPYLDITNQNVTIQPLSRNVFAHGKVLKLTVALLTVCFDNSVHEQTHLDLP
jgi:hypothetical protein